MNPIKKLACLFASLTAVTVGWSYVYHLQGDGLRTKWYTSTIPVQVFADDTTLLSDGLTAAGSIQAAMTEWNAQIGTTQFAPTVEPLPGSPGDLNGISEISFAVDAYGGAFDVNTAVVTLVHTASSDSDRLVESDIIFNTAFTWDSYRGNLNADPSVLDIQRVALRELGRTLGFEYQDTVTPAIMNSAITNTDALQADDIAGAQTIYGASGGLPPANDDFANAISFNLTSGTLQLTGSNVFATKEAGEPSYEDGGGQTVWWKWTASTDGTVTFDTAGSAFDTIMGVFTGPDVASLTPTSAGTSDDDGSLRTSSLTFSATNGTTYYIAVDGYNGGHGADRGPIVLNAHFAVPPVITTQPQTQTVTLGDPVTFTTAVAGSPSCTFQWKKDTVDISGATDSAYSIAHVASGDAGSYTVVATNADGFDTSTAAVLTVNKMAQAAVTINSGSTITFGSGYTATATGGSGTGAFVWTLGSGSTAINAAIDSTTGVVTFDSTGKVHFNVMRAGDANFNDSATTSDFELTVNAASQTITFGALSGKTFGAAPFTVSATASSGLTPTYSIFSGPATLAGNTVTLTGVGTVVVRASQAGDSNFSAATDVDQSFTVSAAATTFALNATTFPYTGSAQGPTINPTPGGATFTSGGTLTATNVGSYTATATATGNYTGTNNSLGWSITQANQTITFGALTGKTFGAAPFTVSATASSGLTPTYSIVSGPATIAGSTVTITGVGTVVVRASQTGDSNYNGATSVDQSFAVSAAATTFALSAATFPYTGSVQGPTINPTPGGATFSAGGTLTATNVGSYTATATATGNYTGTNNSLGWSITQAGQTITFGALGGKTFGASPFTVSATASSGLTPTYSIVSGPATITGNTVTITGAGTVVVRASQAGNSNLSAATPVDQSFAVSKATPVINWSAPAPITFGTALGSTQLNATASAQASPSVVQTVGTSDDSLGTTLVAPSMNSTSGNLMIVGISFGYTDSLPSVSDNYGNTYVPVMAAFHDPIEDQTYQAFYCPNFVGGAGHVVTVTFAGLDEWRRVLVSEITNASLTNPIDKFVTNAATHGPAVNIGTITPTQDNELIFAWMTVNGQHDTLTVGNGFTFSNAVSVDDWTWWSEYLLQGTAASQDITATMNNGDGMSGMAISIRGAASVPGAFVYNPASGAVLGVGTQTLNVSFTPTDTTDYNGATAQQSLTVNSSGLTSQTITFGALGGKTFGAAPFTVGATASSGLTPTFSIFSGPATIAGSTVTITGVGTVVVRASQAGDSTYSAAPDVDQSFTVSAAATTFALSATTFPYTGSAQGPTINPTPGAATFSSGGTLTATNVGSYTATATATGNYTGTNNSLGWSITQAGQTITFGALGGKTFGAAPFTVSATASSGLTPTYSIVSGPATIAGNTVTLTGVGTVVVRASQAGDTNYSAATPVDQSFTVSAAATTFALSATTFPYTGSVQGPTINPTPVGATFTPGGTQTATNVGSYTATATATGNYTGSNNSLSWSITQASQTITFGALGGKTFGASPFTVSATASSGLTPTYSIFSGPATIAGSTVTITGVGTVVVRASQAGNSNFSAATPVDQSFTVSAAATTFALNTTTFTYTGSVQGPTINPTPVGATFTPGGTLTATNVGSYTATAAATGNYSGSNNSLAWSVTQASQTITFGALGGKTFGAAPFTVSATASSGLTPTYSIVSGPATIAGSTVTITGTGTVVVRASQAGDSNFNAASDVDQSFTVSAAATTFALSATTFPYTGAAQGPTINPTPGGATFNSGGTLTATNVGSYTATATATGNYTGTNNSLGWSITQANQTITFGALSAKTFGAAPFTVSATASSGLTPTYSIVSGPATIAGNTVTITGVGTVVVRASQAGDSNFNAATPVDQSFAVSAAATTFALSATTFPYTGAAQGPTINPTPGAATFSSGGTLTATNVGSYTATATATGNYTGTNNSLGWSITQAGQTITFGALGGKTFGASPFTVSATASSGLTPTYSIVSGPATIAGTTVTVTGAGTVVVRASQAGDSNFSAATPVDQSFAVSKADQSAVTITSASKLKFGAAYTATATGGSGTGNIVWSLGVGSTATLASIDSATGAVTVSGPGTVVFNALRSGDANYNDSAATADFTLTLDGTAPTLDTIVRHAPLTINTAAANLTFRVTFSEAVTGVDVSDFTLSVINGSAGGTISSVTPASSSVYDVAVTSVAGNGELRLDLKASGTGIADLVGNALADGGFTAGESYLVGNTSVFDTTSLSLAGESPAGPAGSTMVAQRFTTAAGAPLTLKTVAALYGTVTASPSQTATINADSSGTPGAVVATLTPSAGPVANGLNIWTTSTLLDANTTYWIVFAEDAGTGTFNVTRTAGTSGGLGSWLGASDYNYSTFNGTVWSAPQAGALLLALGAENVAPVITSALTAAGTVGDAISTYTVTANGAPTSYSATGLPPGLSIDTTTGDITGTPATTAGSPFSVTIGATNAFGTGTDTLVFTVAPGSQTITFGALSAKTFGAAPFTVSATASSGLTPTYSIVSGPATSAGSTVTITGAGAVVVRASQAGDSDYSAAPDVDQSFTVSAAATTFALSATTFAYTGAAQGPTINPTPVGATFSSGGTLTATNAGTYTATATATGNYSGTNNSLGWSITQASQTITFGALGGKTFGAAPFTVSATASSGLTPTYSIASGPATITGNTVTVTGAGTVVVRASQAGDTNYSAATPVDQGFTVSAAATTFALGASSFPYTGSVQGPTISPTPVGATFSSGGTLMATNVGNYTATATATGNYSGTNNSLAWSITQAGQTVTFGALGAKTFGAAPFTVSATASSGLTPTYSIVSGPAAIVGNTVTITGVGTVVVRASQAGDTNFSAAADVDQGFAVSAAATTFALSATTFPYTGSAQGPTINPTPGAATFSSGGTLTATNVGSYTATATATGNYTGTNNSLGWSITQAGQTITFGALSAKTFGAAPFTVSATASSGLTPTYSIFSGPATIAGNTVTITGVGTVVVRASQAGDSNFSAATPVDQSFVVSATATTFALSATTFTYTGSAQGPTINATPGAATFSSGGTLTATNVGNYMATATATGNYSGTNNALAWSITKASQAALSINSSPTGTFGAAYSPTATGGSGTGTLSWALGAGSTAPGAAINASSGAITSTGAGTVVIRVTKATDANYLVATSADFTITLAKSGQAPLSVNSSPSGTFNTAYTATATGGSGTGALSWALGAGSTAPGAAINASSGAVTSTGAGTVVVNATKATDTNYLVATSADFTITLGKAAQAALSITSASTHAFGAAYTATATGGSGTGTLSWALGAGSTAPTAAINASTGAVTSSGTGTVVFKVIRAGDANYLVSATTADFTLTITPVVAAPPDDFDGDGHSDLLWHNTSSGLVASWTSGAGFKAFGVEGGGWTAIGSGDYDGDGKADVLWRNSSTGLIASWTSSGGFTAFGVEGGGWTAIGSGDFDGDGKADVLWRNSITGLVASWTSGAGFTAFGTESGGWVAIDSADFDGDGKADVLWHNTSTGLVASWTSSAGFTAFGAEGGGWAVLDRGDFDGDGKADVLWHNSSTGLVASWTSTAGYTTFGTEGGGWQVLSTGDFDGDGRSEPLWSNTISGQISAWPSAGGYISFGTENGVWKVIE